MILKSNHVLSNQIQKHQQGQNSKVKITLITFNFQGKFHTDLPVPISAKNGGDRANTKSFEEKSSKQKDDRSEERDRCS